MNVLFITPDFYPSSTGFANATINLIEAILKYSNGKYKVFAFTEQVLGDNKEYEGIEVYRYLNTGCTNKFARLQYERKRYNDIKKYIQDKKIDIIFFETNTFPFLQNWILNDFKDKVYVRIHSTADTEVPIYGEHPTVGSKISFKLMKKFMQKVDNILATSEFYLDFIKREYLDSNVYTIWDNKNYGILYNTSVEGMKKAPHQMKNHFMTMGKMSSNGITQKGITDLIKGVYYLKINNELPSDFKLTIVGEGEKFDYIKSLIDQYYISGYIVLIPRATHEEVLDMISKTKAIVLLSRYEGQSMFITESLSAGKPLLLSDNNGMQDMIIDGVNGFVTRTGDPIGAAQNIKKICDMEEIDIIRMGRESRSIYENKFSPEEVYKQFNYLISIHEGN